MQIKRFMGFFKVAEGGKAYPFICWHSSWSKAEENKVVPSVTSVHPSFDNHTVLRWDAWTPD